MGGSGKSTLCKEIAGEIGTDPFSDATLTWNDSARAGHKCLGELVARLLRTNQDCVMDEAHLVDAGFRKEFRRFCDEFLRDVKQKWIFLERDVVACINNVFREWEKENGRKELSRLTSLANQIKEYKVPLASEFEGHEFETRPVHSQEPRKFKACEQDAAICWLYKTIFEETVIRK
jgi:hypothetical protein